MFFKQCIHFKVRGSEKILFSDECSLLSFFKESYQAIEFSNCFKHIFDCIYFGVYASWLHESNPTFYNSVFLKSQLSSFYALKNNFRYGYYFICS